MLKVNRKGGVENTTWAQLSGRSSNRRTDRSSAVGVDPPHNGSTTGNAAGLTRVLRSLTLTCMLLLDRDRQIVMSIGRFRQLAAAHIQALHFSELKSSEMLYRALRRLVERKYLARIERRMVGGTGAGSGQYVYQLGREGWKLYGHERKYWPFRAVDYHTLGIADAYIELLQREQSGTIEILGYQTEPESWRAIGGADLRPDLFVDIGLPHKGERVKLWLEIDMGTERQTKIKEKLASYWHAYKNSTQEELPTFPRVVFLAPDDMRARELRYIIEHGPKDAQKLFLVSTVAHYGALLFG